MKHKNHFRSIALAALLLAVRSAGAQEAVTKSGTLITPAPRGPLTELPKRTTPPPLPGVRPVYIAVCPTDLAAALQPLLQWRRQQGYQVELICPATHKRDTIRQLLMQRNLAASPLHPAQQYVLLVGDADRIQAFIGKHTPAGLNSSVTDLYYGEYTNDYLPEAAVGRLPAASSTELALMVDKIIGYEQGRWAARQHQLLLAAGSEAASLAATTTNGQVNYLAGLAADYRPELDTVCFYNPSSATLRSQLIAALNQGNALVNYTAHCTRAGWSNPSVTGPLVDTLAHDVPTIFVNNCCLSNAFDGTCFGEQLLRTADGGAAAVIGATNETLWNEDYYWAVGAKVPPTLTPLHDTLRPGAFDPLMEARSANTDGCTLGDLLQAGCRAVSQSGSVYDAFYWETYCLLGDPATKPYLGTADTLELALLDTLRAGATHLHLAASPGCLITAMADTLPLGCATADGNGEAHITLSLPITADTLLLTATMHDAVPTMLKIAAKSVTEARLAATEYWLDETSEPTLHVRLKNISNKHACRHIVMLWQDSADRANGISATPAAPIQITLEGEADTLLHISLGQLAAGSQPLLRAHLSLNDSNNHTYSTLNILTETIDPRPTLTRLQLTDSTGHAVRMIVPCNRYWVDYDLAAPADSVTWGGEGAEWVEDAVLEVTDENRLHLVVTPHRDAWHQSFDYYFTCYGSVENFEQGLNHYPWKMNNLYPWQIDSSECHNGSQSLRSGAIGNNMQSELVLDIDAASDDSLYFWLKVSSEAGDFLNFYVDGKRRGWWSGNTGWKQWGCPIAAGPHRLLWSYQKNASGTERSDCAWIDQVELPFCSWDTSYGISCGRPAAAIAEAAEYGRLEIYPNPGREITIAMESNPQARMLAIFDPLGRMEDKIFIAPACTFIQYSATHLRYHSYTLVLYDAHQQPIAIRKLIVPDK